MGVGIWYEMVVSEPVAYLYKNADPGGSLRANVSNAAVRCLSNMRLDRMMVDRHAMSRAVRAEVSRHSREWGYSVGGVYVRKVHFRDTGMIRQIEQKVADDPEISHVLFEVLEVQGLLRSPDLRVTLVPPGSTILVDPTRPNTPQSG